MRRLSSRSFCARENASSDSLAFTCCHVHPAVHGRLAHRIMSKPSSYASMISCTMPSTTRGSFKS
eukprot:9288811-Heterocapsa_arctica.AAC.1